MKDITSDNFGLLIAYVLPGLTALWGVSYIVPEVNAWLFGTDEAGPTVGGFFSVTLASVGAGLTVSTMRWAVIDPLMHWWGIPRPLSDAKGLQQHIHAYIVMTENHYRYYQFYGSTILAIICSLLLRRIALGWEATWSVDLAGMMLVILFLAGARDAYRKYSVRLNRVLSGESRKAELPTDTTAVPPPPEDS